MVSGRGCHGWRVDAGSVIFSRGWPLKPHCGLMPEVSTGPEKTIQSDSDGPASLPETGFLRSIRRQIRLIDMNSRK